MIIYISGPMSGLPEMNFPAFAEAAARLRELGHTVISPHEVELPQYPKGYKPKTEAERLEMWIAFMREDIKQLMGADTVAVLPGWGKSTGANIEVNLGFDLGFKIMHLEELIL
jgi:hypothetical protein